MNTIKVPFTDSEVAHLSRCQELLGFSSLHGLIRYLVVTECIKLELNHGK